ncbi:MAG: hypothetical protein ACI9U2_001529, partial [Bradymonadia bacterium]
LRGLRQRSASLNQQRLATGLSVKARSHSGLIDRASLRLDTRLCGQPLGLHQSPLGSLGLGGGFNFSAEVGEQVRLHNGLLSEGDEGGTPCRDARSSDSIYAPIYA